LIEKTRWTLEFGGHTWEVDEFAGVNAPLVVAEVELESETQAVPLPEWVGEEVSTDYHYTNAYLAQNPYSFWPR
jgi:adenylate cyclase